MPRSLFVGNEEFYRFRRATERGHWGTLLPWLVPMAIVTGVRMMLPSGRAYRLLDLLHRSACPACGYQLRPMHEVLIAARSERDVRTLQACPECGYAWPLLPPDAKDVERVT